MWPRSSGDVCQGIQLGAVAGELKCLHRSRVLCVRGRVGIDGGGNLLGVNTTT